MGTYSTKVIAPSLTTAPDDVTLAVMVKFCEFGLHGWVTLPEVRVVKVGVETARENELFAVAPFASVTVTGYSLLKRALETVGVPEMEPEVESMLRPDGKPGETL